MVIFQDFQISIFRNDGVTRGFPNFIITKCWRRSGIAQFRASHKSDGMISEMSQDPPFYTTVYVSLFGKICKFEDRHSPVTPKILILTHQQQTAFQNIVGKGEIACNKLVTSNFSFSINVFC